MMSETYAYGMWMLVIVNSLVFIAFVFGFTHPITAQDWRSFGAFSGFIVALFAEMFGFPLTIYLLSGWLVHRFPGVNIYSHNSGHLWYILLGPVGSTPLYWIHILSYVVMLGGFVLLAVSWRVLYKAQLNREFAMTGPYAFVRHPQYLAFMIIMLGLFIQWPTFLTAAMFPIMVVMYVRLARREDTAAFGEEYERWAARTPAFIPLVGGRAKFEARHAEENARYKAVGGELE